ncbi:MAG: hypothetical protein AAGJ37_04460 [Pseudomonadota bacterium]
MTAAVKPISVFGIFITGYLALALISFRFPYGQRLSEAPFALHIIVCCVIGAFYLYLLHQLLAKRRKWFSVKLIFWVGILARLVLFPSEPILEDDAYRYFYDGALVNEGINPYSTPPERVNAQTIMPDASILGINPSAVKADPELAFLRDESYVQRVAYPHLGTIYPSVAQIGFWVANRIDAFNIQAWRIVLLLADLLTFLLLIRTLKKHALPSSRVAIYWLNPILLVYGYNAGHMDVLMAPFLVASLFFMQRKQIVMSATYMAAAVGTKLWPVILFPIILKPYLRSPKRVVVACLVFILLCVAFLYPLLAEVGDPTSGLRQFSTTWRTNSFLFGILEDGLFYLQSADVLSISDPNALARITAYGGVVIVIAWRFTLSNSDIDSLISSCLWISSALFLFAPTGYPWYLLWFLPWLVFRPVFPLLLLSCTLMLYPIRFVLIDADNEQIWLHVLNFFQFFPTLALICFYKTRRLWLSEIRESDSLS